MLLTDRQNNFLSVKLRFLNYLRKNETAQINNDNESKFLQV